MNTTTLFTAEICDRGKKLYAVLRAKLDPEHTGKYLVIDVDNGDFEFDANHLAAYDRAHPKRPGAQLYAVRIGWDHIARISAWRGTKK